MSATTDLDLGPLSWVKGEIDLALGRASEALGKFTENTDDTAQLKFAQTHLHQAHGALSIVGLDGVTQFSETIEQLLGDLEKGQLADTAEAGMLAQKAFAAIRHYLDEIAAGGANQPLKLLPVYRELLAARGIDRTATSDLFFPDLSQRPPKRTENASPLAADRLKAERARFERGFLKWLRNANDDTGLAEMRAAVAAIEATQALPAARAFWWVTLGLLDALAMRQVPVDLNVKKLCARIDLQMRRLMEGSKTVAERLMRDALYFVAVAKGGGEHVRQVKQTYGLDDLVPISAEDIEPLKPVLRAMRDSLTATKDAWNRFCGGSAVALPQFHDGAANLASRDNGQVSDHLVRLVGSIAETAQWLRKDPLKQNESVAMEIATALLLAESALENYEQLGSDFPHQVDIVVDRLASLMQGKALAPLEAPLLDDMSRRAQERLLISQVAREILSNLAQVEQALDAYFRDPEKRADLANLSSPLKQIEGALTIMGQDRAVVLLRECDAHIQGFAEADYQPQASQFEEVAHKLSGLGFFVDALQHGPANLDEILQPPQPNTQITPEESIAEEAPTPSVEAELEQQQREAQALIEVLREKPQDEGLREELKHSLETIRQDASLVADAQLEQEAKAALAALAAGPEAGDEMHEAVARVAPSATVEMVAPSAETLRLAEAPSEEIDAEILGIFLEEAHEVLSTIGEHLQLLRGEPHNHDYLITIRRAFHTLKGSGRMVGLTDLGEAAWAVEQVMNKWLQSEQGATPPLYKLVEDAHALFEDWVAQLDAGDGTHKDAGALIAEAARIKGGDDAAPIHATAAVTPEPILNIELPTELHADAELASDLGEIDIPLLELDLVEEAPATEEPTIELPEFTLELPSEPQAEQEAPVAPIEEEITLTLPEFGESEMEAMELATTQVESGPEAPIDVQIEAPAEFVAEFAFEAPVEPPEALTEAQPVADTVALGELVVSRSLYDMYVNEARGHLSTMRLDLNALKLVAQVPPEPMVRAAHTLAGISGTVGIASISRLAMALEHALNRIARSGQSSNSGQLGLIGTAVSTLEAMVFAVAELRVPHGADGLAAELDEVARSIQRPSFELSIVPPGEAEVIEAVEAQDVAEPAEVPAPIFELPHVGLELPAEPAAEETPPPIESAEIVADTSAEQVELLHPEFEPLSDDEAQDRRKQRMLDDLDEQLLPIFLEEAVELMREIGESLRTWHATPGDNEIPAALQRLLHTLKGSARMAGAMGMGELIHGMETRIEQALVLNAITPVFLEELDTAYDRANFLLDRLQRLAAGELPEEAPAGESAPAEGSLTAEAEELVAARAVLRVRADLVDRLVNEAGEMSIARARIEGEMRTLRQSLLDLTENVIRLRGQLREIEIHAESQMQSQLAQAHLVHADFDPLEFDRFTRFQEITRMMAEGVNDVTTVQHALLRNLDNADAAIVSQARQNRELSQALMSVRMVPFNSISDRLYRVVRLTAKELGKKANLDIRGGQLELDRSVLEKMTGPIEHLLRNAITHGLEGREQRLASGKPELGQISLALSQEGNEVVIEMTDDGSGLDHERIRTKAIEQGLLDADAQPDETTLTNFIFHPGFSTAKELTEIAGRGVGMDVVKSEAAELGGRVEASSVRGQGARFRVYLPLTLTVAQALLVRVGGRTYALPSVMVEQVTELKTAAAEKIRNDGYAEWLGNRYPFFFLPMLLGDANAVPEPQRRESILLLRSGTQRVAVQVDELRGNQEIVIKNIGPQLARVIGISGATVLGDGEVVLILNPIALASREHKVDVRHEGDAADGVPAVTAAPAVPRLPTVMIVDDSLTVRKITSRLLSREGYQVLTAKDGVDALEQLLDVLPDVMLVDIEMPRMDGFDLTRNVRGDARLKYVPIIMITSRIADKHRNYAKEIGVNHYLGKPFQEDELLALIAQYTGREVAAPV